VIEINWKAMVIFICLYSFLLHRKSPRSVVGRRGLPSIQSLNKGILLNESENRFSEIIPAGENGYARVTKEEHLDENTYYNMEFEGTYIFNTYVCISEWLCVTENSFLNVKTMHTAYIIVDKLDKSFKEL
jgi:hypothetical protein